MHACISRPRHGQSRWRDDPGGSRRETDVVPCATQAPNHQSSAKYGGDQARANAFRNFYLCDNFLPCHPLAMNTPIHTLCPNPHFVHFSAPTSINWSLAHTHVHLHLHKHTAHTRMCTHAHMRDSLVCVRAYIFVYAAKQATAPATRERPQHLRVLVRVLSLVHIPFTCSLSCHHHYQQ